MRSPILYEPDPKIERTFHRWKKKERIKKQIDEARRNPINMVGGGGDQRRTLRDFATHKVQGINSGIAYPTINANNFELKPAFILMVQQSQSRGTPLEDPNLRFLVFLQVCDR